MKRGNYAGAAKVAQGSQEILMGRRSSVLGAKAEAL
jgi:hypothetical protein